MLLSTGERVSMALLSSRSRRAASDAICFTGSQSRHHHRTTATSTRASSRCAPTASRTSWRAGKIVIVAGYQGMSYRREITTLGRGGSDTTAVALAAALGPSAARSTATSTASTRPTRASCPTRGTCPSLDHGELQEMAEAGAKVLNAQAVEWARRAGIAIYARKTFDPHAAGATRETIVRKVAPSERLGGARGGGRGQRGARAPRRRRPASTTCSAPRARRGSRCKDLSFGPRGGSLSSRSSTCPTGPAPGSSSPLRSPGLELAEGVAVVSVVGDGFAATPEPLVRFLGALRGAGIAELLVDGDAAPARRGHRRRRGRRRRSGRCTQRSWRADGARRHARSCGERCGGGAASSASLIASW